MNVDGAGQRDAVDRQFLFVSAISRETGEQNSDQRDKADNEAQANHSLTRAWRGRRRPTLASMKPMMRSSPSLFFRLVITTGPSPPIRFASVSIFSSDAPTCGARSILLITSRSERVMPGPPLEGILSPAATSIT